MKRGGGKRKGSAFEREQIKLWSLWWTESERDDVFERTRNSGGKAKTASKKGKINKTQFGDMTYNDAIGKPLIELWSLEFKIGYGKKRLKGMTSWCALDVLDSSIKLPSLCEFWKQCCEDAANSLRNPILVFQRHQRSPCIAMFSHYAVKLEEYFGIYPYNAIAIKDPNIVIMKQVDFFSWANPNTIASMYEEKKYHDKSNRDSKLPVSPKHTPRPRLRSQRHNGLF